MCLLSKQNVRKVADSDIECYKVVEKKPTKNIFKEIDGYEYRSLFVSYNYGNEFNVGTVLVPEFLKWEQIENEKNGTIKVTGGFIHSYEHLEDAVKIAKNKAVSPYSEIYKCIIPKGTEYYIGCFDSGVISYAAKKMVVVGGVYFNKD